MPRTAIAGLDAPGGYADVGLNLAMVAADVPNKQSTRATGKEIIIARNSGATVPRNVTITSTPDHFGRTNDLTQAMAIGTVYLFGPFPLDGWRQTDGNLYFEADNAEVLFQVIRIP